jgi:hypothetical protein
MGGKGDSVQIMGGNGVQIVIKLVILKRNVLRFFMTKNKLSIMIV